ncbi:MAG TPA: LysR family transcriptional regulator [Devosiaceae bacterium]|nr:LysR family transcriptional regulator [Devosiaceae bacterium]
MNFAALDLNLLRIFDVMMMELSTVRAGGRLGLTQSAVSAALGRLRQILGDDLFVREGNRMVPTPRALALQEPVRTALRQIEGALSAAAGFDPATADRDFVLAGSDYVSTFLMPRLARVVRPEAPGVTLQMLDVPPQQAFSFLSEGRVDVAVERQMETPDWIGNAALYRSFVVVVARKGHPVLSLQGVAPGECIPPEVYCAIPQVVLSTDGTKTGSVDPELRRLGFSRSVRMTVPHFHAVAIAVASSDLLGNIPVHFARYAARLLDLHLYLPPFDPRTIEMRMYWHRRLERDPGHAWLREKIAEVMAFDATYPPPNLTTPARLPWDG